MCLSFNPIALLNFSNASCLPDQFQPPTHCPLSSLGLHFSSVKIANPSKAGFLQFPSHDWKSSMILCFLIISQHRMEDVLTITRKSFIHVICHMTPVELNPPKHATAANISCPFSGAASSLLSDHLHIPRYLQNDLVTSLKVISPCYEQDNKPKMSYFY